MSADTTTKSFWSSVIFRTLLAVAVGFILWAIIPEGNGLTATGVRFLAIFIACMILWVAVSTDWAALLFLGMLVVGNIMAPGAMWAASIGNPIVALVLVYTLLAVCLTQNGVMDAITAWFITRPFVKGRPYAFMTMFFAAHFVVGIFMHNFAIFIVFLNIIVRLCKQLGVEKNHKLYICLMLGNLWVNGIINGATPIAKTIPNIIIGLIESLTGVVVTYGQWLAVGIPFMVVGLAVVILAIRIINPDVSALRNLDVDEFVANTPKMTKGGKIAIVATLIVVAVTILPEIFLEIGILTGISSYLMGLGISVPAVIAIAALCLIRADGKPVMDYISCIKEVPLAMLIFIGGIMVMGVPLSSPETGVLTWLTNILDPIFGGMPVMLIIAFNLFGALLITQFVSNTVPAILFLNLGVAIFLGMGGVSIPMIIAFSVTLAVASSLATLAPSATIVTPLVIGPHVTMGNSAVFNIIFLVIAFVATVAWAPVTAGIMSLFIGG